MSDASRGCASHPRPEGVLSPRSFAKELKALASMAKKKQTTNNSAIKLEPIAKTM